MGKVDLDKLRSIRFGSRSRKKVQYGRDEAGYRTKATTDELGNTVTEHADPTDRVDVAIKAPGIRLGATEVREP